MKLQSYQKFWQKIHQSARNKGFPLRVMFELTYRCNFLCGHCYVPFNYREKSELKTKEIFSILDRLKEAGCFYLGFTGGEPFMRQDIMDILWYAKRCGFEVIIYTNGSLIDKKMAQELGRLRPNKVDITIPAMTETAFQKITQVAVAQRRVFQAIEFLHKKGVALGFKTCVLKENQAEIKEIQKFAASLGALHRLDDMLSPRLDGSPEPFRYRGSLEVGCTSHVTRSTSQTINSPAISYNSDNLKLDCNENLPMTYDQRPKTLFKCGVGISQVAITPLGELKLCLMIDYPRFKISSSHTSRVSRHTLHITRGQNGLQKAWQGLKEFVSSIKPDENYQCHHCNFQPYCKWCPAHSWLYDKSFTSCNPENRQKAEVSRQLLNC